VLLSLKWPAKPAETNPDDVDELRALEIRDRAPTAPALLARSGVKFAFYADGVERRADFFQAVKKALDAGLSADDAVRALTLTPAEIYGVADRMGSIEKGKIANLVITQGDLFQEKTLVKFVVVDGVKYEPVEEAPPTRPGAESVTAPEAAGKYFEQAEACSTVAQTSARTTRGGPSQISETLSGCRAGCQPAAGSLPASGAACQAAAGWQPALRAKTTNCSFYMAYSMGFWRVCADRLFPQSLATYLQNGVKQ